MNLEFGAVMNKYKTLVLVFSFLLIVLNQLSLGASETDSNDQQIIENLEFFESYDLLNEEDFMTEELALLLE